MTYESTNFWKKLLDVTFKSYKSSDESSVLYITLFRILGTLRNEISENYLKTLVPQCFEFLFQEKMYWDLFVELFESNPELTSKL